MGFDSCADTQVLDISVLEHGWWGQAGLFCRVEGGFGRILVFMVAR